MICQTSNLQTASWNNQWPFFRARGSLAQSGSRRNMRVVPELRYRRQCLNELVFLGGLIYYLPTEYTHVRPNLTHIRLSLQIQTPFLSRFIRMCFCTLYKPTDLHTQNCLVFMNEWISLSNSEVKYHSYHSCWSWIYFFWKEWLRKTFERVKMIDRKSLL